MPLCCRDSDSSQCPFAAIDSEQVSRQVACYGKRSPITGAFLHFFFARASERGSAGER
jgi:hypothetical protein